jgi:hypothetical protein
MKKHFHLFHYLFKNFDAAVQNGKTGLNVCREVGAGGDRMESVPMDTSSGETADKKDREAVYAIRH